MNTENVVTCLRIAEIDASVIPTGNAFEIERQLIVAPCRITSRNDRISATALIESAHQTAILDEPGATKNFPFIEEAVVEVVTEQ